MFTSFIQQLNGILIVNIFISSDHRLLRRRRRCHHRVSFICSSPSDNILQNVRAERYDDGKPSRRQLISQWMIEDEGVANGNADVR